MVDNDLTRGDGRGGYGSVGQLSRAQVAMFLWRLEGEPQVGSGAPFADVPAGAWFAPAVRWAKDNGVIQGRDANTFDPYAPITRAELVAILWRYAVPGATCPASETVTTVC
jgi:hypothetical protein